jgi:hypothetical protein
MNKRFLPLLIACIMLTALLPARSQSADGSLSQWIIAIETKTMPNILNYKESRLKPVSEATVSIRANNPHAEPVSYERFWGARGKTLAMEREGDLGIPRGQSVAFKIVHGEKRPDYAETQLAVDAMLRVLLDAQLNSSPLFFVRVPSDTYQDAVDALLQQNFLVKCNAPETPLQTALLIYVIDENGLQRTALFYPL